VKLTPWFDERIIPTRVGVYQREYRSEPEIRYCLWDGRRWMFPRLNARDAAFERQVSNVIGLRWRGRAKKP